MSRKSLLLIRTNSGLGSLAAPFLQVADFQSLRALIRWLPKLFDIPA